jgi:hypothetical protein
LLLIKLIPRSKFPINPTKPISETNHKTGLEFRKFEFGDDMGFGAGDLEFGPRR